VFRTLLIANRGEIACRIMRTARRLGIRTVAVYSDADADAAHVRLADSAVRLGPAPARDSYLSVAAVLDAARRSGATALHPGYGFLSENAEFAAACARAGVEFIGPPVEALAAMGSKRAAKETMRRAGVPVLPGYHGEAQSLEALEREALKVGLPIMVKPSGGGGGKGMQVVTRAEEIRPALESARRLAASAFADPTLLLERYLPAPRHVEVQVLADRQGTVLHLFDRDCSVQRRHQKLIEEAPAPGIEPAVRARLHAAAVTVARAVGYLSAGTVEFLYADGEFWFMEMNARLQVEHPVTEMITGLDLVEWQLRIAAGEPLPFRQEELRCDGHAVEARVCAEDPAAGHAPSAGRLSRLDWPGETPGVRVDAGFFTGDVVPSDYDSLLGKVISHAPSRPLASERLARALEEVRLIGVRGNAEWLARVLRHPDFVRGEVSTRFLEAHAADLAVPVGATPKSACLAAVALAELPSVAGHSGSPWAVPDAFRLNLPRRLEWRLAAGPQLFRVLLERQGERWRASTGELELCLRWSGSGGRCRVEIDGESEPVEAVREGEALHLWAGGAHQVFLLADPREQAGEAEPVAGELTARLPGTVVSVAVAPGTQVESGQLLLVVEAMKMEHAIRAPSRGTVTAVHYQAGDRVEEGARLLEFEPAP
jgi:3-methylcrotonyl-CoA carboxylase alpha subunit